MPDAADLRVLRSDEVTWVFAGKTALFRFADGDSAMRNIAVAALRQIGFPGTQVAAALGLTTNYVATLHQRAQRDGTAGLVRPRGRPRMVTEEDWEQARAWRAAGVRDAEIARRLGVQQSTVLRRLGPAQVQGELALEDAADRGPAATAGREDQPPRPQPEAVPEHDAQEPEQPGPAPQPEPGVVPPAFAGTARAAAGSGVFSRYAGAMLLHAYPGQAGEILPDAAGGDAREAALLSAVSMCFALGAATAEQVKHLVPAEAGPLAGLAVLPSLRTLRPRLAAIADAADPLKLQAAFATAMLAASPETSGVYYVDDHFVPYTGAKPVGKGWNNKRGRAEKGRADTHVTTHDGRAVCFVTGEPSGLSVTLPKALAELTKAVPAGTPIMLGFDRGGAYPAVFAHCRDNGVHWVTYRRAPLTAPAMLPVLATVTANGRTRTIAWTDETVQLKDYGSARQITLFEHGRVVLQILTSDSGACPAALLGWLKSRWREENFLKYASQNYGIDAICDYLADIETNTKIVDNPARKEGNAAVREAEKNLAAAERGLAALLADPAITPADKNARLIPAAERAIAAARRKLDTAKKARNAIPAKLPASQINPDAQVALLRTGRRGLQMVLRLLAHNAEHWLSGQLNAYLRDDDEYRAITRQTIIRGTAGVIAFAPDAITVTLQRPAEPRVARALTLLIDQVNAVPPRMPGDTRPITHQLTANPTI
ncbi:MAG: putative transposase [Streptosporangiaceae bacterium]